MRSIAKLACACAAAVWFSTAIPALGNEGPSIAVAANMQVAAEEIATAFKEETGHGLRLSFGSSGNFARQIRQGAPFELFLSADEEMVIDLARDGFTRDQGTVYAIGRIVLLVSDTATIEPHETLDNLRTDLEAGAIGRVAIANPEHAPYGKAAREALQAVGLWEMVEPRLVVGENVAQAAQFVVSGNAEVGIVAYSLALAESVASRTSFAIIPSELHKDLSQRMALVSGAGPVAERFYNYLQSTRSKEILRRYGFALPGEEGS